MNAEMKDFHERLLRKYLGTDSLTDGYCPSWDALRRVILVASGMGEKTSGFPDAIIVLKDGIETYACIGIDCLTKDLEEGDSKKEAVQSFTQWFMESLKGDSNGKTGVSFCSCSDFNGDESYATKKSSVELITSNEAINASSVLKKITVDCAMRLMMTILQKFFSVSASSIKNKELDKLNDKSIGAADDEFGDKLLN
jgi:hypothetical protein